MPDQLTIGSLSNYVIRNPFMVAAALLVPLFAQNEDRDYFRTALLTTPVVFAAGAFGPKLLTGIKELIKLVPKFAEVPKKAAKWTKFEDVSYEGLNALIQDPMADPETVRRAIASYLDVAEPATKDLAKEEASLEKIIKKYIKTPELVSAAGEGDPAAVALVAEVDAIQKTKGELISSAIQSARVSSLTPAEWAEELNPADWDKPTSVPGVLDNSQMLSIVEKYKSREDFVRTLNNRLREVEELTYEKTLATVDDTLVTSVTHLHPIDFGWDTLARDALQKQAPETYNYLEQAANMDNLTIEVETEGTGKSIGKVLKINVSKMTSDGPKKLSIPVVDRVTGEVRLTPNSIGVGDWVIDPAYNEYRIDTWIAKMMVDNPTIPFSSKVSEIPSLQAEIDAHAYWRAGDPMDARRMAELDSMVELGSSKEVGPATFGAQARKLRSQVAKITKLPLFVNEKRELVTYKQLPAEQQVGIVEDILRTKRYINMSSEAGTYEGRFVLREAANLSPWGAPSAEKQDPIWRSVTKEFRLAPRPAQGGPLQTFESTEFTLPATKVTNDTMAKALEESGLATTQEASKFPREMQPGWRSTAWESLTGSSELPAVKFTVSGISPQDRTLFSELPKTLSELHFQREEITQKFIERGMTGHEATQMYEDVYKMYSEGKQGVLTYLGGMGETVTVMKPSFADQLQVEGVSQYKATRVGVKVGDRVNVSKAIGFNRYDRVLPKAQGVVKDIARNEKEFVINVTHQYSMQGAKLDIAGVKGLNQVTDSDESFEGLRNLINTFYSRIGGKDYIPETTNVLAPAEYLNNKIEPAFGYMGIGTDLTKRLRASGAEAATTDYLAQMEKEGVTFQNDEFVIDAARNEIGTDRGIADRVANLTNIHEDFFARAEEEIRTAGGWQDPVLQAFTKSETSLGDWMLKNQLPAMGFAWDHSLVNSPRFSTVTYDVETYMGLQNNLAGVRALKGRLRTVSGGNPRQALDFAKYVMEGDYTKEMGTTIPMSEAFRNKDDLHVAANRARSIFDPSEERFKNNFRLDLGEGKFLPVPGTGAYQAEGSLYDPGLYQTTRWQHTLQELAFEDDPTKAAKLQATVVEQYKEMFAVGKGSALRPYMYDPMGVPGVLGASAEQGDLFTARISREIVEKIHSESLRRSLLEGGTAVGMIHRQPTNFLPYMKFKMDPNLHGTLGIAIPERVSRLMYGDIDKDPVNAFLFDAKLKLSGEEGEVDRALVVNAASNDLERGAAEEALQAIGSGKQLRQVQAMEQVLGTPEVANLNKAFEMKGLKPMAEKFIESVRNRVGIAVNRTAGGAIGSYSNVLTEITEHMSRNPILLRDEAAAMRLNAVTFALTRQIPISARKAHATFSLDTAMKKLTQLKAAIYSPNPTTSAEELHSTYMSLGKSVHRDWLERPEYQYLSSEVSKQDLRELAIGRTSSARLAKEAFTATVRQDMPFDVQSAAKNLPKVFRDVEEVLGPLHGGKMATESASRLGTIAEGIAKVSRDAAVPVMEQIRTVFKAHGKSMALGLGAIAALGIALTPRSAPGASFSAVSSNKYRPEEAVGSTDHIPGEPVSGQMAPSNPPRRMVMPQPGVRTAVVAPMGQTSDVTVRMRATDTSRAAETSRLLSQIPGGDQSNVTINYRDRTKLHSLRLREKIRELRK